ncbi:MAG: SGNH/GDSL hydrolase family protein [Sedimentisphaerales bacterium]|nr:SGNH/GDSL hydrolase family protein [Sedimentisphaerales bacterium]
MKKRNMTSRRNFLKSVTATAIGSTALLSSGCNKIAGNSACPKRGSVITKGSTILFQGDSITDAGRVRKRENNANDSKAFGKGYVYFIASQLSADYPSDNFKIYNRGISGNKVFQLADRWDRDCLALKPDVLSILIGVNDIWHALKGKSDGTVEKYEKDYAKLLKRTLKELPDVKLVICEPFVLRCGAVNDKWFPEFDKYRAVARKMAANSNAIFVPFQSMFDKAVRQAPAKHWAADGVHPTMAGGHLMAEKWLETVRKSKV